MDLIRSVLAGRPTAARSANLTALLEAERRRLGTWSGSFVSDYTAMQHLTVWSCVSLIADAVGMLPVHAYRPGPDVGSAPTLLPTPAVLLEPHVEMDRYEWDVRMLWSLLMRGNAYGWIMDRDRNGAPLQVLPLHPDEVAVTRSTRTGEKAYSVGGSFGAPSAIPIADIMHVKGLVLPGSGSVLGLSPVEYARQVIGVGLAATEFAAKFFGEGAVPSGILTADGALDAETATEYQDRWEDAHGNKSRRVAVLGGGLHYEKVSLTPDESQFLETRKFTRSEIAGFYRCPPHLVGDVDRSTSWGTGIEEQGHQFVTFTLNPWLRRLESAWTRALGTRIYARYNVSALLRGRTYERYQTYTLARQAGVLNIDEIRTLEELPALPEGKGQDYLQPLNYAPIPPGGGPPEAAPAPAPAPPA